MPSNKGFRAAVGALALSALLGAPPAVQAATHGTPDARAAGSGWQQLAGAIEARIGGLLRMIGWGGPAAGGAGKRQPLVPGATASGGSSGTGSGPDQSGGQDPNG
ncbi:MAG TPA: hypothetical protein VMW75_22205 [Thermoanaerobaculia bacterium]|nr:hypothetical protein [Thermoanaerobaculia bacterium]